MTIKEYLKTPSIIRKKIRYLELDLERYENMMYSCSSPQYDSVRVDKSPRKDTPNQRALEKYYETEEKIKEKEKELEKVIEEIIGIIDKLEIEEYRLLLRYRYIDEMTIEQIADKLYVAVITVKKWQHKVLELIEVPQ